MEAEFEFFSTAHLLSVFIEFYQFLQMLESCLGVFLGLGEESLGAVGEGLGEGGVACLVHEELPVAPGGCLAVQGEGILALVLESGVKPE